MSATKAPAMIRIDSQVYEVIRAHSLGMGDTPNRVLRRMFGLDPKPDDKKDAPEERRRKSV